jgi:hypothetical protein
MKPFFGHENYSYGRFLKKWGIEGFQVPKL